MTIRVFIHGLNQPESWRLNKSGKQVPLEVPDRFDAVEKDLKKSDSASFQLHEKYLGRIFDIVDVLSVVVKKL